jgi:hypothetical protein
MHPKNTKNAKKMHTEIAKITQKMPKIIYIWGLSKYWVSPITSFHHIGFPRNYRDILVPIPHLTCDRWQAVCLKTMTCSGKLLRNAHIMANL